MKTIIHGGGTHGFCTQMLRITSDSLSIFCFSNIFVFDVDKYTAAVADIFLGTSKKAENIIVENKNSKSNLKNIDGFYFDDASKLWHIVETDSTSIIVGNKKLKNADASTYNLANWFGFATNLFFDTIAQTVTETHNYTSNTHVYKLLKKDSLRKEFIGKYICEELKGLLFECQFVNNKFRFMVDKKWIADVIESYTNKCRIAPWDVLIEFEFDANNKVIGFRISRDRFKKLKFIRQK